MKIFLVLAAGCFLVAGCAKGAAMETGNGIGGGTVGTSFSGSSGAGAKAASGSAGGVRDANTPGAASN